MIKINNKTKRTNITSSYVTSAHCIHPSFYKTKDYTKL